MQSLTFLVNSDLLVQTQPFGYKKTEDARFYFLFLDPLPPRRVHLSNKGHTDKLIAAWQPSSGDQDSYVLTLYYAGSGSVAAKTFVKDTTNFTFLGLVAGSKYFLEVASVAGPYRISTANVSDWTCAYDSIHALPC